MTGVQGAEPKQEAEMDRRRRWKQEEDRRERWRNDKRCEEGRQQQTQKPTTASQRTLKTSHDGKKDSIQDWMN